MYRTLILLRDALFFLRQFDAESKKQGNGNINKYKKGYHGMVISRPKRKGPPRVTQAVCHSKQGRVEKKRYSTCAVENERGLEDCVRYRVSID